MMSHTTTVIFTVTTVRTYNFAPDNVMIIFKCPQFIRNSHIAGQRVVQQSACRLSHFSDCAIGQLL